MDRWVEFVREEKVKDHTGAVVESFAAGEKVFLRECSADRWIRRGAAVEAEAPASVVARGRKKAEPPPPLVEEEPPAVEALPGYEPEPTEGAEE